MSQRATDCALDKAPRELSPHIRGMFRLFAELIAFHVDAHIWLATGAQDLATSREDLATSRPDLAKSAAILVDERATAELREQFIAVLGHDLRNPLASIDAGAKLLGRENLSERGRTVLGLLRRSVARMGSLIDDVLNFARGRLGGGIGVEMGAQGPLIPMLRQVVGEIQSNRPDQGIEVDLDNISDCHCDPVRIGQLLSNLMVNAVTHGNEAMPIWVRGSVTDGHVELAATNGGEPIPPGAMAGLFKPYVRASEPAGAGPWALYRLRDRQGAWREVGGDVRPGGDHLHLQDAGLSGGVATNYTTLAGDSGPASCHGAGI